MMMDLCKEEDKEGSSKNMYLYGEEPNERPAVSTILSKLANYNYLPLTTKEGDPNGTPKGGGGAQLGTIAGVFLPCIQNIFGVILFIRMVWIVGTAGVPAAFLIVFICCSVTFCTSISLSAIATNGIVPAGGSYFMISRALGPEFGGAVGVLFFLATGVAGAMYIAGAIEIILKYITPELALFGDLNEQSVLYHNIRFYGTMILIVSVIIVFIGVKFVSKVAPFALAVCLLSIFSIYFGVFINYNGTPDTFCMVGSRIMSNTGYKNCNKNSSDPDSIWHVFCVFHNQSVTEPDQVKVGPGLYNRRLDIRLQHRSEIDGTMIEPHWDCDSYFKNHEVKLARSVPGIASGVIKENLALHHLSSLLFFKLSISSSFEYSFFSSFLSLSFSCQFFALYFILFSPFHPSKTSPNFIQSTLSVCLFIKSILFNFSYYLQGSFQLITLCQIE